MRKKEAESVDWQRHLRVDIPPPYDGCCQSKRRFFPTKDERVCRKKRENFPSLVFPGYNHIVAHRSFRVISPPKAEQNVVELAILFTTFFFAPTHCFELQRKKSKFSLNNLLVREIPKWVAERLCTLDGGILEKELFVHGALTLTRESLSQKSSNKEEKKRLDIHSMGFKGKKSVL